MHCIYFVSLKSFITPSTSSFSDATISICSLKCKRNGSSNLVYSYFSWLWKLREAFFNSHCILHLDCHSKPHYVDHFFVGIPYKLFILIFHFSCKISSNKHLNLALHFEQLHWISLIRLHFSCSRLFQGPFNILANVKFIVFTKIYSKMTTIPLAPK